MPTMTNRPRLTSAQFLGAHRRALETISDLYAAIEEMPILAAADPSTMKRFFDELADVQATAAKLAQHFRTQYAPKKRIRIPFESCLMRFKPHGSCVLTRKRFTNQTTETSR